MPLSRFLCFSVFLYAKEERLCCDAFFTAEATRKTLKSEQRIPQKWRSCIDVTGPLSLVSRLAWFCTHPEVKFHVFDRLKRGEEKSIGNFFFDFHTRTTRRFDQANKKKKEICHIHFKRKSVISVSSEFEN